MGKGKTCVAPDYPVYEDCDRRNACSLCVCARATDRREFLAGRVAVRHPAPAAVMILIFRFIHLRARLYSTGKEKKRRRRQQRQRRYARNVEAFSANTTGRICVRSGPVVCSPVGFSKPALCVYAAETKSRGESANGPLEFFKYDMPWVTKLSFGRDLPKTSPLRNDFYNY